MPSFPQKTYHVFSLPRTLLDALVPSNRRARLPPATLADEQNAETEERQLGDQNALGRACNVCAGVAFPDVDDQRAHFRSDWHRYNVKLRVNGGSPVNEARFTQLVEGLDESLSGSASSEDDDDSDSDAVSNLIARMKSARASSRSPSPDAAASKPHTALAWFHAPPATQIGVYKALFSPANNAETDYISELRAVQRGHGEGRKWALFMVAGGHFAGAIVRVSPSDDEAEAEGLEEGALPQDGDAKKKKKQKPKKPKPETEVLMHKTFHRYTTRRKQGGSQSVNDNAKSKAKSAGAQLRRYGEQALRDDIQNLMKEWAEDLDDCERIWIRASVANRRMFMEDNGGLIAKGDVRLRTFPFPTRRPTQSELLRCLNELVHVKVTHFTEDELREQDEAFLASLPKPKPRPAAPKAEETAAAPSLPVAPKLTPEEVALRERWVRAIDMIEHGRRDALAGHLASLGGADARVPSWMGDESSGRTFLMLATAARQPELVRFLLEDARADPTAEVLGREDDDSGAESDASVGERRVAASGRRTAYDLARTKEVRNVFRRCAGAYADWWDWQGVGAGGARVPSVLTKEMEELRDEKKKARRKGLKDKVKEREGKETKSVVVVDPPPQPIVAEEKTGPRRLGGAGSGGDGITGLTPEMRAKVERERRARAAEARIRALGGR